MNPQALGLGGVERTPDPRDFPLGAFSPDQSIPAVFMQDLSNIEVEHQHQIPACGSHAGAFLKDVQETIETKTPQRKSPMFLWKKIKLIDGYPPESGTDMLSIFKTLKAVGVCDSSLMPNDTSVSVSEYTDHSTVTPAMNENAKNALVGVYGFAWAPSFEQIKRAIYENKAILMLIKVGEEMWTPSWDEVDILPMRPPKNIVSGHFVVGHSYDEKRIYFRNSWGNTWGRAGDGYFEENYLPFVIEIGTAVDVPKGTFNKDLYYGMANVDVWTLQKFLVKGGFGTFTPTGFFGFKTLEAVKKFQTKYSIPNTGYVGVLTRARLNMLVV